MLTDLLKNYQNENINEIRNVNTKLTMADYIEEELLENISQNTCQNATKKPLNEYRLKFIQQIIGTIGSLNKLYNRIEKKFADWSHFKLMNSVIDVEFSEINEYREELPNFALKHIKLIRLLRNEKLLLYLVNRIYESLYSMRVHLSNNDSENYYVKHSIFWTRVRNVLNNCNEFEWLYETVMFGSMIQNPSRYISKEIVENSLNRYCKEFGFDDVYNDIRFAIVPNYNKNIHLPWKLSIIGYKSNLTAIGEAYPLINEARKLYKIYNANKEYAYNSFILKPLRKLTILHLLSCVTRIISKLPNPLSLNYYPGEIEIGVKYEENDKLCRKIMAACKIYVDYFDCPFKAVETVDEDTFMPTFSMFTPIRKASDETIFNILYKSNNVDNIENIHDIDDMAYLKQTVEDTINKFSDYYKEFNEYDL